MKSAVVFALTVVSAASFIFLSGCGSSSAPPAVASPAMQAAIAQDHPDWAEHEPQAGLPNFARVSENVYRGGKPSGDGIRQLKSMGVKTVVDLGWWFFEIDNLRDPVLSYIRIPFYTYNAKDSDVVRFLELATDKSRGPIYVHCRRGADRTGFMIAVYRVAVSGWTREEAIAEMTQGGFGFDPEYQNLIEYIRTRDIPALAQQAGIKPAPAIAHQRPSGEAAVAKLE